MALRRGSGESDRGREATFSVIVCAHNEARRQALQLTERQAAKLWSFEPALCRAVLSTLGERRFLVRPRGATFVRP